VQNVAAFINILLPFQHPRRPILGQGAGAPPSPPIPAPAGGSRYGAPPPGGGPPLRPVPEAQLVSLVPYIRRLVVTGFDNGPVLHGFFGDDWAAGVGIVLEQERRNYLFAMKSDSWLRVKETYDMPDGQFVPFLKPLQNVTEKEIQAAEAHWSEALAMQDWMLGPRAPPGVTGRGIKREEDDDD